LWHFSCSAFDQLLTLDRTSIIYTTSTDPKERRCVSIGKVKSDYTQLNQPAAVVIFTQNCGKCSGMSEAISMHGALVQADGHTPLTDSEVAVQINFCGLILSVNATVLPHTGPELALAFENIDPEKLEMLKKIIQLNNQDPALMQQELQQYFALHERGPLLRNRGRHR